MEPEEPTPSGKKKFLLIPLIAILIIAGVLGYRSLYYLAGIEPPEAAGHLPPRELTEAEKLLKSQIEAMDKLRAEYQSQNTPPATTTLENQIKQLDAVRINQNTTSKIPKKTLEQQIKEMDALRSATTTN